MIFRMRKRASLTVETALIMPAYMFALLALASILLMYLAGMRIRASVVTAAEDLAMICADGRNICAKDVKDMIVGGLATEDERLIENGFDGISLEGSFLDDPEYIELCVGCNLIPLTGCFGVIRIPFAVRCMSHVWCGYERGFFPDGEYVYVTEGSEVFHRDRECSHIKLTVQKVSGSDVSKLRNSDGARYKRCEICHGRLTDKELYITPDGDRYHGSVTCAGLKRTVRAIRIEEVGDRRPCSRCGR